MKKIFVFLLALNSIDCVIAQVAPQSGSATFNLPMFNWSDDKSRLNGVVALNYSSGSGLKVGDVASNVGQGWSLVAGGVITRMQVGQPDDQKPYRIEPESSDDLTKYPAGYLYDPLSSTAGCPTALTKYPIYKDKNHLYKQHNSTTADRELDYFAFQFNGRTGLFVLGKSTGFYQNLGVLFLGETKLKAWYDKDETAPDQGIRTTITAFYIQDENGLIYKFSNREFTRVLKYSFCDANLIEDHKQPDFKNGKVYHEAPFPDINIHNPTVINSWYLTEIKDPLTLRVINFNYELRNITADAGISLSHYKEKNYSIISHHKSITQTPELTSIVFPDGHQVNFNYGKSRADLIGGKALESVDVTYLSRYISKYELITSYFILNRYGIPQGQWQRKNARLCLLSVRRTGVDLKANEQPYMFDYHMGSSNADDFVPPPFTHVKDIWGFYNGNYSLGENNAIISATSDISTLTNIDIKRLCFLMDNSDMILNAKPGYAKNGLLKQIIYPTGGMLTYEYAQNEGTFSGNTIPAAGVHVSQTKLTDGGFSNDCDNPIVTNYAYKLEGSSQTSLWGLEEPLNSMTIKSHYAQEDKYFYMRNFLSFGCDYRYKYPGIQSRDQAISLTGHQQFMQTFSKVLDIVSGIMTVVDIVNLYFYSSVVGAWVAVIIDIIASLTTIILTCTAANNENETTTIYYNSDLRASNPLPNQFKRVEVTESSGGNGRTVMEFTSRDHCEIWEPDNPTLSMKQRYGHWAYGLPKKTTVLDASGNKIKETENEYDFLNSKRTVNSHGVYAYPSCKCEVKESSSQRNTDWELLVSNTYATSTILDVLVVDPYYIYTGRVDLTDTYERVFKPGNQTQYLETRTQYLYNSNFQLREITTTESSGQKKVKQIQYSGDSYGSVFDILNQNNIISLPVSTSNFVDKPGVGRLLLAENTIEYAFVANGDIKPNRTLEKRLNAPGSPVNPIPVETQSFTYDAGSNLIAMKDEGQRMISNIYDYNNKYVVASVINADPVLDKSAYTSFETSALGGWTLAGFAGYSGTAVTGARSFSLSALNNLTANLNTSKPYRLSFWANSAISVSSGATLEKSAPTINGFTYYEYSIAQGTSSITVNGVANIDELRLYPQTARMRTVTYDPLIGKTAESDENNRNTYYEYDALGRLQFIKDESKNITKMYEYNQANRPTGCVVTYYNKAITEVFTKDNCPAGYIGGDFIYTIPANTYSSTISQAAADQLAENQLNAYGQLAANSVNCIQIFGNDPLSVTFTKQGCATGTTGTNYVYTVPANKYTSLSKLDANLMAQTEVDANGQAFANLPGNASCVTDYTAVWEGTGLEQCQSGHRMIQVMNVNPNSSGHGETQWVDTGTDPECPAVSYIDITYENYNSSEITVEFIDPATGNILYSFQLNGTNGTLYSVAEGMYHVRMYDPLGMSHYYQICGLFYGDIDKTFLNVNVSSSGCNSISID